MKKVPTHCPHRHQIVNNHLYLNQQDIVQIAQQFDGPFYAYDRQKMTDRVNLLNDIFPDEINFHYAIKANPMPDVVNHMATITTGFDLASGGELTVALASGMSPDHISFAGPGKSNAELTQGITAGITLNIESETELQRINSIGQSLGKRPNVAIRVNPDFELKSSGMKMAGGAKPFGIDAERVPEVIQQIMEMNIHFRGFHIYSGSQNLRPESLIEAQSETLKLAAELATHYPGKIELLNLGGGFGIPYFPGETELDLQPVADALAVELEKYREQLAGTEFVIELGRYLVGEAGAYICQIIDKKVSRGICYLITNGGLHHHLAASGNFGQVIRKNYPTLIANKVASASTELVTIVGPLCTPLDILANNMDLPQAEIGDYVAILQSGAYGFTASPHLFLSHPAPQEILL